MTEIKAKKDGAVIHCRVSANKQSQEGESLEVQEKNCLALLEHRDWQLVHEPWLVSFSGRKNERSDFLEILNFIDKNSGKVQHYIFRSIDRFTRGGTIAYDRMKQELARRGVDMVDSYGVIQPPKNTLEHTGFQYDWSMQSPSEISEAVMSTTAKAEVSTILTRMIGQEINLTQQGFQVRQENDGFINQRVHVEGKKRVIQIPDPARGKYYITMFELRASGRYTDEEIVDRVNAMGYLTKPRVRWDKNHRNPIGAVGGKPLTVKRLQEHIKKPIYCGVKIEKWTRQLPIKTPYSGLVSVDTFNKANRGKVFIKENSDGSLQVLYNFNPDKVIQRKLRHNPEYPYKFILCPKCKKAFLGSSSRGRSGQKFPVYHCTNSHRRFAIRKKIFDASVENYVHNLQFDPQILNSLQAVFLDRYRERQGEIMQVAAEVGHNVADLESQKAQATKAYIATTSSGVRQSIEEEIDKLSEQIKTAQAERNKLEVTESDIENFVREAKQVMEHPAEMLLNTANMRQQQALFGLVFEEIPTYGQIVNGTATLTWLFKLSEQFGQQKSEVVSRLGGELAH